MIGDDIKNWKDYLEFKFADDSLYHISDNTDKLNDGIYRIKSKTNETVIDFIWPDQDWSTLDDIQYYSSLAKGWSGELLGANNPEKGVFNQHNLRLVEQLLETPINEGWISEEYYINKKLYKAITYKYKKEEKGSKIYTDFNNSCLSFLLLPFTVLANLLLHSGLIGHKKIILVEPVVQ